MKATTVWKEKMKFSGEAAGFKVDLDAKSPIGSGSAPSPKELVLIGLCGCTAMDVVAYLRKLKEPLKGLEVGVNALTSSAGVHPAVFTQFELIFELKGNLALEKVKEAVELSQTKYCGISAMLSLAAPIFYKVQINGTPAFEGKAAF